MPPISSIVVQVTMKLAFHLFSQQKRWKCWENLRTNERTNRGRENERMKSQNEQDKRYIMLTVLIKRLLSKPIHRQRSESTECSSTNCSRRIPLAKPNWLRNKVQERGLATKLPSTFLQTMPWLLESTRSPLQALNLQERIEARETHKSGIQKGDHSEPPSNSGYLCRTV